jgi:opacity protein-like surface antigen
MKINFSYLTYNKEFRMNLSKKYLVLFLVLFVAASAFPQSDAQLSKTGTTAGQFLKIGVGPRAIGMGGAFTAVSDDITSFYWNPSGLAKMYSREAFFNHVDWIADVSMEHAGFAMNITDFGTLGAFISVLSMGDEMVRTVEQPEGTGELFSAGSMLIGISFARSLTEDFSIGVNAKFIREYIWNESDATFAFDIGTMYTIPFLNKFTIAASISNFGSKMRLEGRDIRSTQRVGEGDANLIETNLELDSYDLPLLFRIGVAMDAVKDQNNRLTLAVDAIHPNDHYEHLNTGLEYSWNELFFIRGGYKSLFERDGEQGLSFGVGINYRLIESVRVKVDYAYQDFGRLSNVQYLSLGLRF